MLWKLQSWMWSLLPVGRAVSITVRLFGLLLALSLAIFVLGWLARRRWLSRSGMALASAALLTWGLLIAGRPAWLKAAVQPLVPGPAISALRWETRSPGLETADLEIRVGNAVVDHMALTRLDPHQFRFSVHWDPTGRRQAEDWQRELGAAVVVSGSYFGKDFAPLTPLRLAGQPLGPPVYQSSHGSFVSDGERVDILDLQDKDVFKTINAFPEAMVSYPLLIDGNGNNRAVESKDWLASRNFIGLDDAGRVVLGTTETGFFTLHRLGEFLKSTPLGLRLALNLDGGPLVSQVVHAGSFTRNFHGQAEMTDGQDVLRAFCQANLPAHWPLPVVLVATPTVPSGRVDQPAERPK